MRGAASGCKFTHRKRQMDSRHGIIDSETIGAAHDLIPWGNVRGDELLKRTAHANRVEIANVIRQRKTYFAQAMDEIRRALKTEGVEGIE